jgi:hypothetical protein
LLHVTISRASTTDDNPAVDYPGDFESLWPQNQSRPIIYSRSSTRRSVSNGQSSDLASEATLHKNVNDPASRDNQAACRRIPPSIDSTRVVRDVHLARVANECE